MTNFWMNDASTLLGSFTLVPNKDYSLEENLNAIMRLAIVSSVFIALVKPILAVIVLIIIAAITASSYSEAKQSVAVEFYTDVDEFKKEFECTNVSFCNDSRPWQDSNECVSPNDLSGPANPKTMIPPIIAPRSHDITAWRMNDTIQHSGINSSSAYDIYRSESNTSDICTRPVSNTNMFEMFENKRQLSGQSNNEGINFTQYNMFNEPQKDPSGYDPRYSGYGSQQQRGYIDDMGRPQFFYDDINSVTMPPFISRNNLDVFPWINHPNYRQRANDEFTNSTIRFRTEMQESLMRKGNAQLWQQKLYPITTMKK